MSGTRAVSFLGPSDTDSGAALTDPELGAGAGAEGMTTGSGEGAEGAAGEGDGDGGTTVPTGGLEASRGW
jgi:hypothetical protein